MKVADLQQYLGDLKKLLEAAGTKGAIITDMVAIGAGLAPFREHSLKEFAEFLVRAEAFSRGEVPVKPTKKAAAPKKSKEPSADANSLAQEAKRLYEHASDPAVTPEMIENFADQLRGLGKAGLSTVAAAVDYRVATKETIKAIVEAVKKRILDRKGSYIRAGLAERPTAPTTSPLNGSVEAGQVQPAVNK